MTSPDPLPWETEQRGEKPLKIDARAKRINWAMTAVIILGAVAIAVAFIIKSWVLGAVGLVVAVVAAVVAYRAGVLRDVRH